MGTRTRPNERDGLIPDDAFDWNRMFLRVLEGHLLAAGEKLEATSGPVDFRRTALRAVLQALLDSGAGMDSVCDEIATVLFEVMKPAGGAAWTAEMNQRRFELIDRDIQGQLTAAELMELELLTQSMRRHVDTEVELPFAGALELHRRLVEKTPVSTDFPE